MNTKLHQKIVADFFPGVTDEEIIINNAGWDYIVYITRNTVFRFPRDKSATDSLIISHRFLKNFSRILPLKTPESEVREKAGIVFETYPYLKGIEFNKSLVQNLKSEKLSENARILGNFLEVLHGLPLSEAAHLGLHINSAEKEISKDRKRALNALASYYLRHPETKDSEREKVKSYVDSFYHYFLKTFLDESFPEKVVHADIFPQHLLVDKHSLLLTTILDFGDVCIGDPAIDFRWIYFLGRNLYHLIRSFYNPKIDSNFEKRLFFYSQREDIIMLERSLVKNWGMEKTEEICLNLKKVAETGAIPT